MSTNIIPPFLDLSFNYGLNPNVASQKIHHDLKVISEATFLKVNDQGTIEEISFIEWVWERLKGIVGFIDHTKKELIRLRVKQLLVCGAENGYIQKEDFLGTDSLINNLVKNMGLTPGEPNRIHDLEEFDELIHAIAAKTFNPEAKVPDYRQWITKYQMRHLRDFEPHSIISRIWLECFDALTLDDELSEVPLKKPAKPIVAIKIPAVQELPLLPIEEASDIPTPYIIDVPKATQKTSSWTKKIGLGLLGTGLAASTYYAGQKYLKTPIPIPLVSTPTPIESSKLSYLSLLCVVLVPAVIYITHRIMEKKKSLASNNASMRESSLGTGSGFSPDTISYGLSSPHTYTASLNTSAKGKDSVTGSSTISTKQEEERDTNGSPKKNRSETPVITEEGRSPTVDERTGGTGEEEKSQKDDIREDLKNFKLGPMDRSWAFYEEGSNHSPSGASSDSHS